MSKWEWVIKFVGFALEVGGKYEKEIKEFVFVMSEKLASQWAKLFKNHDILILGHKQSGKTSLIYFMKNKNKMPYEIVNGEKRTADPTLAIALIGKRCQLQATNWLKIKSDVPGDVALRDAWKQVIDEVNPEGIIYMIDGRLNKKTMQDEVNCIFKDVLGNYNDSRRKLQVLNVFINFCDQWYTSPAVEREMLAYVRDLFEKKISSYPNVESIHFNVEKTHLNPNAESWKETKRALHKFGADLM